MLEDKGLYKPIPIGFSFQECLTLFTSLDIVSKEIASGELNNVLILVFDFPLDRVKSFGLYSDAVSSSIMSGSHEGLTLGTCQLRYNLAGSMGKQNNKERIMFAKSCLDKTLVQQGIKLTVVTKLFSTNFYHGLARFNQMMLGISTEKFYIDSAKEVSHCGNSDSIVNLIHFFENGYIEKHDEKIYVLQVYANGYCGHVVLTGPTTS